MAIKIYRSTEARRSASTTILDAGALLITDEGFAYVSDGVTRANALAATSVAITDHGDGTVSIGGTTQTPPTTKLPSAGTLTYDTNGNVLTDTEGLTYTYNADNTLHTVSDGTTTRTFAYNSDGTIASIT